MGIPINTAETIAEIFDSPGVAAALESVFKHKPFTFDDDSREYAEVARAYWTLIAEKPELFSGPIFSSVVPSVMPADVAHEATDRFRWREETVDILFRRVLTGIKRTYGDFQQMTAISALDKTTGFFSSHDNSAMSNVTTDTPRSGRGQVRG